MLIIIFFLLGAFFIISENKLALNKEGNLNKFSSLYLSWISQVFENTKATTGYIVKLDWLPNETG